MNSDLLGYVMISLIVIISYKMYTESDLFHLKCIISEVDGNKYCVRERNKLELAADKLAQVNNNMKDLVKHCSENFTNKDNRQSTIDGRYIS